MSRILRTYIIREVALPVLLTLMTMIFILLMGKVYQYITLLMQPSVSFFQVLDVLGSLIPSLMVLAVPMAALIGVLIGVGRMTLDREMLAARASGINLFTIFLPLVVLGLIASLTIMGLYAKVIPKVASHGLTGISKMQLAVITALEPGQFHDSKDLMLGNMGEFEFFFRERDPQNNNTMKGIMLKLEQDTETAKQVKKKEEKKKEELKEMKKAEKKGGAKNRPAAAKPASPLDDILSSSTQRQADAALATSAPAAPAMDAPTTASYRKNVITFITAESGTIQMPSAENEGKSQSPREAPMIMNLKNGSIHQYNPDPKQRMYTMVRFAGLKKYLTNSADSIKKPWQAKTNRELRDLLKKKTKDKDEIEFQGSARRELTQRYALSLASFVFILIGIPLAIWVRPSGKSWGILLAVGLMLIYYLIMQAGLGMVRYDKPIGYVVTFSPNLLFLALGAGLWWHSVRS